MDNVLIVNPQKFAEIRAKFKVGGADSIHVLSDFDRTLTQSYVNGHRVPAIISILREDSYLSSDYPEKAQALYDKYAPLETNLQLSRDDRKSAMESWWRDHFALLIASGLTRSEIQRACQSSGVLMRQGASEFLHVLSDNNIPLVFLSASGLGVESVRYFLDWNKHLFENIHIICNDFIFDESGKFISVKEPIVHICNKDETLIHDFPCYSEVKERKNVIVVGDSVDDVDMVVGFEYDNLIKFGFLNEKLEENLEKYKEVFDVIITQDGSFSEINKFLKYIIS